MVEQKKISGIVPTGSLRQLSVSQIKPSTNNPRQLFDEGPLSELKESIRQHGVLVPLTVYKIAGQEKYAILDGERRYTCCDELEKEGQKVTIPANIVVPPTKIAGLLYMFSIHNFREQWELMPTAISLKTVMQELNETDNKKLSDLTGLSKTQVERCKILLTYPEQFQKLSLEQDPKLRIPSNFWIEAYPVIGIYEKRVPEYVRELGRNSLIQKLVEKYRNKKIVSVIHFRRIIEASEKTQEGDRKEQFEKRLSQFIQKEDLETRDVFDVFLPARNITNAIKSSEEFLEKLQSVEAQFITESDKDLRKALRKVAAYINQLLDKTSDQDEPKKG